MNYLSLSLHAHPRLTMLLRCAVCAQPLDHDTRVEHQTLIRLFGERPFATCPGCGQSGEDADTPKYRGRWRYLRRLFRASGPAAVEARIARWAGEQK